MLLMNHTLPENLEVDPGDFCYQKYKISFQTFKTIKHNKYFSRNTLLLK